MHGPTVGEDRVRAWSAATGERVFVWGSGWGNGRTVGAVRRAFGKWQREEEAGGMTIYHDGVGADFLGALDTSRQKIYAVHSRPPRWERAFDFFIRCTGKVMTGSDAGKALLRERFGWIPERYIAVVAPPVWSGREQKRTDEEGTEGKRCGIWLRGGNWRVLGNRLRALVDRWGETDGELEIMVGGGKQPKWAKRPGVRWRSGLEVEAAMERLGRWEGVLLWQDFDLEAPWLLAALARGAYVMVPEGEGRAAVSGWEAESAPRPYAWGDAGGALERWREWQTAEAAVKMAYREWGKRQVERSEGDWVGREWSPSVERLMAQRVPRLSRRRGGAGWVPVWWYERVLRLRSGISG